MTGFCEMCRMHARERTSIPLENQRGFSSDASFFQCGREKSIRNLFVFPLWTKLFVERTSWDIFFVPSAAADWTRLQYCVLVVFTILGCRKRYHFTVALLINNVF